jgi:EAL domain-containing protein (putative c-di-GMP-specific phosphodiesterase class I)
VWGEQVRDLCTSPAGFFAMRGEGAWMGADDIGGSSTIAFAPLCAGDRMVGILILGAARAAGTSSARVGERLLAEAIDYAMVLTGVLGAEFGMRRDRQQVHEDITQLIATRAFAPVFQPLIDLRDDTLVGFEALTRFADGTAPERRFAEAHLVGDGAELELAAMSAALEASTALPDDAFVSVNVSPTVVIDCTDELTTVLQDAPRPAVLELTEHHRVDDYGALRTALDQLAPPVRVSVDDAGAGYASLRHVLRLAPDFVKLDRSWVTGIDDDTTRQALVAGLSHFAEETGCDLVAEGIESVSERETLARLGVTIGQGYLLGLPEAPT